MDIGIGRLWDALPLRSQWWMRLLIDACGLLLLLVVVVIVATGRCRLANEQVCLSASTTCRVNEHPNTVCWMSCSLLIHVSAPIGDRYVGLAVCWRSRCMWPWISCVVAMICMYVIVFRHVSANTVSWFWKQNACNNGEIGRKERSSTALDVATRWCWCDVMCMFVDNV